MVRESASAEAPAAPSGPAAPTPHSAAHSATPESAFARFRVRFRKGGDLRLVSHHDLMHCFERMLRRAALPILHTHGFHPQPRMTFALSLALGILGGEEVVELEFEDGLSADDVHRRLAAQAPPGLDILRVRMVERKAKLQVRRSWYRAAVPAACRDAMPLRIADFLARNECWIERSRPQPRRLNIRPFISVLKFDDGAVVMALWITSHGAARPEEVLQLLGLGEYFAAGELLLERTTLELLDEVPPDAESPPPSLPQPPRPAHDPRDLRHGEPKEQTKDTGLSSEGKTAATGAAESAPRPTALISDPLEFDS